MKRWFNVSVQLLGLAAHVANLLLPVFSGDNKIIVAAMIAAVQGITGILAHASNPDGTPASVAYDEPK